MRNFLEHNDGAVSTDWVVLAAAVVGLGAAALSSISTGSLDMADRTASALNNVQITTDADSAQSISDTDDPAAWGPWVDRFEIDGNDIWTYNDQNQLVHQNTGEVEPINPVTDADGTTTFFNIRGELTDQTGVLIS
ncbi:MAG: hypothetical protein ACPG5U_09165 [Planktomarina sp.]